MQHRRQIAQRLAQIDDANQSPFDQHGQGQVHGGLLAHVLLTGPAGYLSPQRLSDQRVALQVCTLSILLGIYQYLALGIQDTDAGIQLRGELKRGVGEVSQVQVDERGIADWRSDILGLDGEIALSLLEGIEGRVWVLSRLSFDHCARDESLGRQAGLRSKAVLHGLQEVLLQK